MRRVHTFCGICEPHCALLAEVDDDRIRLLPDRRHPVHRGFACHKGLKFTEVHEDPDRLNHPRRRTGAGTFESIAWPEALGDIAERPSMLSATHGPESVGVCFGNPLGFNSTGRDTAREFARALGVRYAFGSDTQVRCT